MTTIIGEIIGDRLSYDKHERLGEGSYGTVFVGYYMDDDNGRMKFTKQVAVKRFQLASSETGPSSSFDREKEILQKANHPNILRYVCSVMNDNFIFLATERCQATLDEYVKGSYQGQRFDDVIEILSQMTTGLAYLHSLKIVHRDIKPTNILIFAPSSNNDEGIIIKPQIKLADFGISKILEENKVDCTNTSTTNPKGSKGWMAPEVYESNRFDFKVDVWALGLVFFYTLSDGKHPFGDDQDERAVRIKKKEPMLLTETDLIESIDVQSGFEMIKSMLTVEPKNRPTVTDILKHTFFIDERLAAYSSYEPEYLFTAQDLLPCCRFVGENPSGMKLYQLPLNMKSQSSSSKIDRWTFGSHRPTLAESKTILLMGATGSGKTTLINAMVNYILGVEFKDPFRFLLISEEDTSSLSNSQTHSQTSKVTAYEICHEKPFRIPFSIIILNTPSYGDTGGVDKDVEIMDSINELFKEKDGVQVLDAVGFTMHAALTHLSPTQKNIFASISAIFGNDVKDNISFLVTFADGQTPPVLEAIKEANITHQLDTRGQPRHYRFNNSGFFTPSRPSFFWKLFDSDPMFCWALGMKNFESFFSDLSLMQTRSLTLTKEVLEERKRINVTIEELKMKISKHLTNMEEFREVKQTCERGRDRENAIKDFKFDVIVSKGTKVANSDGKYTNFCSKCAMSCHFPCGESADKQKCSVMDSNGFCTSCPGKCKWDLHSKENYYWVFEDVTETHTYGDFMRKNALQKKYLKKKYRNIENLSQDLQAKLNQIKCDLESDVSTIDACLQRLDCIALRPNAFTSTDYIKSMIQIEMGMRKRGFRERIESLISLLNSIRVMEKIRSFEN